jgi:predicted RNA-binding Zn-ribbon protein involved in translation (DUF1610 family)
MAVILICPKCGHEFKSNTLNIKDPSEIDVTAMGTKEACPNCNVVSTFDSSMFEYKPE